MTSAKRRTFLKASSATMALPWLDSLGGFAHAADADRGPQRLLMICLPLSIYPEALNPTDEGFGYQAPEYLSILDEFRDKYTVISGLHHPGVTGGHHTESRIFTGIPSHLKNSQSLDQYVAKQIGQQTRFDSLVLAAGRNGYSWTGSGTKVPEKSSMAEVYNDLFGQDNQNQVEQKLTDIEHGKSIMNLVERQAKKLRPSLSSADQTKLEEYFSSVRETERRFVKSESWVHTPKPSVDFPQPTDPADRSEIITQLKNVCDMTYLAFQTDSTRVVTFGYFQQNKVNIPGVSNAYHALSHHGKDPANIAQLKKIESVFFNELERLLTRLKNTKEGDSNLLDQTTIVVTSNLGSGSSHSNKKLPLLVLGGNFNHGQHLRFDSDADVPMSNVFVSILNQFGIADKTFGTATGPLDGLEIG